MKNQPVRIEYEIEIWSEDPEPRYMTILASNLLVVEQKILERISGFKRVRIRYAMLRNIADSWLEELYPDGRVRLLSKG